VKFPFATEGGALVTNDPSHPFEIDPNGVLIRGTITANSAEAISFVKNTDINADNFQLKFKFDNGGEWRASAAAAYSKADQDSASANNDVRYTQYTVRGTNGVGFAPNQRAPANYQLTYDANGGTLPSFSLVGTPDLYTNPANGFFKSHWAFADTTDAENWAVRGDVQWDPPFIESGAVSFSGGLRLADRKIDYEFGRYLADYSGKGELDGSDFGQNWTPFGYFQDGAIGFKSCEIPASAGANFRFAPCERFGNSPALITPYQTLPAVPAGSRPSTVSGAPATRHGQRAGARPRANEQRAGVDPVACTRTRRSRSSPRRWRPSRSKRRPHRATSWPMPASPAIAITSTSARASSIPS
jgi:hypothetical protein